MAKKKMGAGAKAKAKKIDKNGRYFVIFRNLKESTSNGSKPQYSGVPSEIQDLAVTLKGIDSSETHGESPFEIIDPNDGKESIDRLISLRECILKGSFRGLILISFCKELQERLAYKLTIARADIMTHAARLSIAVDAETRERGKLLRPSLGDVNDWGIDEALALAHLTSVQGGFSLVVSTSDLTLLPQSHAASRWRVINRFHFKVAAANEILPINHEGTPEIDHAYLGALTLRRRAGFRRTRVGLSDYDGEFLRNDPDAKPLGFWSFSPDDECNLALRHLRMTDLKRN